MMIQSHFNRNIENCENIQFNDSIVVSIPVGRTGDLGSIPRRGVFF